jgi:hypothetical protein
MRFDETQYVAGQRITNQGRGRPFAPPHVPFNHYSGSGHNYGADLHEDASMRLLVVLASFAAVIGLATPAQADPLVPMRPFSAPSTTPVSPIKTDLTPSPSPGEPAD